MKMELSFLQIKRLTQNATEPEQKIEHECNILNIECWILVGPFTTHCVIPTR